MNLKLTVAKDLDKKMVSMISIADDGQPHNVKITTNKLNIEKDNKDARFIKTLKNVKLVFEIKGKGCFILCGNLGCSFVAPFGGDFFAKRAYIDEKLEYDSVKGYEISDLCFSNNPITIEEMQELLAKIANDDNFVFNISQFDEFMDIFTFYKNLSAELNNNVSYRIISISDPYRYVPIDVKDIPVNENNKVINADGIVIGYSIEDHKYDLLPTELKNQTKKIVDVKITGDEKTLRKVKSFADNLYLSSIEKVTDENSRELVSFDLVNVQKVQDGYIISGETKVSKDLKFVNLYDMGQKVKLESINNSLRLINQGASGSASELLEYIIGSKPMPTGTWRENQSSQTDNTKFTWAVEPSTSSQIKWVGNNNLVRPQIGSTDQSMISSKELIDLLTKKVSNNADNSSGYKILPNQQKYLQGLNDSQKVAFLMATDGAPVSLIKGPPGTGKTHVINAIVQYITKELKEKVVISSQTHIAIDNVLDKLMENHDLIIPNRITNRRNKYSGEQIDITLYNTWAKKFAEHNARSQNQLMAKAVLDDISHFNGQPRFRFSENCEPNDYTVLGATTTTSAIGGKRGLELLEDYDWLIIDEVSKCPITEVLRYLPYVKRIIMVGDDFQLAPLLEFTEEDVRDLPSYDQDKFQKLKSIYEKSVFADTLKKAKQSGRLVTLNENYRSVENILRAYNIFYNYELINKREAVKNTKVAFTNKYPTFNQRDIFFVEVKGGQEVKEGTSRYNLAELEATAVILKDLIENTLNPSTVSVAAIFPYAAQIGKFQKKYLALINQAKKHFKSFEMDTVDAFQGRETDIVLVNTVVADASQRNFLNDFRRINVAMSRSRDKLFVFGNSIVLSQIEMSVTDGNKRKYFRDIINDIKRYGSKIEYNQGGVNYEFTSESKIKLN